MTMLGLRTKATSPFHRDTSWITYSFETGDMLGHDAQLTTSLGKRLPSALHYFNYLKQDFTNKKHYFLAPHFSIFHPSWYIFQGPQTTCQICPLTIVQIAYGQGFPSSYLIILKGIIVCGPSKASEQFIHPTAKEGFPMLVYSSLPVIWKGWFLELVTI